MTAGVRYSPEVEEALIGAALVDARIVPRLVSDLVPTDFYIPALGAIFGAVVALHQAGYAVDPATITDHLRVSGEIEALGDRSVIVRCMGTYGGSHLIPTYIAAVRREATARSLAATLSEGRQALETEADPLAVADLLEDRLRGLSRAGQLPDRYWRSAGDYLATDRSEALSPLAEGVCYPLSRIMVLAATEKGGKALATATPIPTPRGWSTMGSIAVGEEVFGPDGKPRRVIAATEVMHDHDCYRVTFKDGREIVADAGHLWATIDYEGRQHHGATAIHTTRELADTVSARNGHTWNHQIPNCAPLNFEPLGPLPISPYAFGAWLGDGDSVHAAMTCADSQIMDEIAGEGWRVVKTEGLYRWRVTNDKMRDGFESRCRRMGVWGDKHIPEVYFWAPVADRVSLLQGLMDTDGTISDERGMSRCEFSVCNERLARDFHRLVTELGIKASFREAPAKLYGRVVGTRYRVGFQPSLPVFRLARKAEKITPVLTSVPLRRAIVAVTPVESVPVRCIEVDDPDGMFLAGEGCIPTHNSILLRQMAMCFAAGLHPFNARVQIEPVRTLLFDVENDDDELATMERIRSGIERRLGPDAPHPAVYSVPYGVDLATRRDLGDFLAVLEDYRPQLIIGGPIYKMTDQRSDLSEDRRAAIVQTVFNDVRKRWGSAVILEHHAPSAGSGRARDVRAKGGQVWAAWVNMTIALHPTNGGDSAEVRYPHPPRGHFRWPKRFDRGSQLDWPWMPVMRTPVLDVQPPLSGPVPDPEEVPWDEQPF